MKILLISDTHGVLEKTSKIIEYEKADIVLHMGDIGYDEHWLPSVVYVKGNNDRDSKQPKERELVFEHHKIYMTHGDLYESEVMRKIHDLYGTEFEVEVCMRIFEDVMLEVGKLKQADIVCFGHTHYPLVREKDGILLINPGSLLFSSDGKTVTYAILTLHKDSKDVSIVHMDNEL